jgi:AraC family transcriptional regulator
VATTGTAAARRRAVAKPYVLPIDQVRPVVRWAGRHTGWLTIHERTLTDHEFVLILAGGGQFVMRDRTLVISPHTLLAIPPFLPHAFACQPPTEHLAVHFDLAPDVPRFSRARGGRPPYEVRLAPELELPLSTRLEPNGLVEGALIALVESWSRGTAANRLAAIGCLSRAIAAIARPRDAAAQPPLAVREDARLKRALERMAAGLEGPLTLRDCARAAGMSPTRFAHRFREHTGYAPMDYLKRLRVEHARQLLLDPSLSIHAVAERCGFSDPFHFSRVFRAIDGIPPSHYRAMALAGTPAT